MRSPHATYLTFNIWGAMGLHHSTMAQMLLTHLKIIPAGDGDRYQDNVSFLQP